MVIRSTVSQLLAKSDCEQGELPLLTALTPERAHYARAMRDPFGAFKGLTEKVIL